MRRFRFAVLAAVAVVGFATVASAADLPVKAPVAPVAAPYNWTGFYVGANVGGGWGNRSVDYSPNDPAAVILFLPGNAPAAPSFKSSGALGGLQLGYNWQFNRNWLVGLEADFDWSGVKGSSLIPGFIGTNPITTTVDEQIKWFGTVRARLGYLPTDNLLTYMTGGFAYGRVDHSGSYVNTSNLVGSSFSNGPTGGFSFSCSAGKTCFAGSSSSMATGWTAGAGFEYAVWTNVTLKAEYLYVSLSSKAVTETALQTFLGSGVPSSFNANYTRSSFNVGRIGLNYRF